MLAWVVSIIALVAMASPAFAQEDVLWERYFEATHQAFEHGNYFEAHRMFAATSEAAKRSGQNLQFAQRLENLAGQYESAHRLKVAEALYRHALRIYERCLDPQHSVLANSIQKYARVLRNLNRDDQARELEARVREIASSRS
jgi:hypothetical protein